MRWFALIVPLVMGLGLRWIALQQMPVVADEISVMGVGLAKASISESPRGLLFETPLAISNGITPLWFWLQALPAWLFGETSKLGLRTVPVLLGLFSIVLAQRVSLRMFGSRSAWFASLSMAALGLVLYNNVRGEFSESLIIPLLLLMLSDLYPDNEDKPLRLRVALWPALILFTYLGKGILVWIAYCVTLVLVWGLGRMGLRKPTRLSPTRLFMLVVLPLVPSLLWMGIAQIVLFSGVDSLRTDFGIVDSVWEAARKLTIGYGTEVKQFMTADWYDTLYPFTDFSIWPIAGLLAPALIAAPIMAVRDGFRALQERTEQSSGLALERALLPLAVCVPTFVLLVYKGTIGARFHLLYLVPLLPYAAFMIDRWLGLLETGRKRSFVGFGSLACIYVAWTAAWEDRIKGPLDWSRWALLAGTGVAVLLLLATVCPLRGLAQTRARVASLGVTLLLLVIPFMGGVLRWGQRFAWEPEPRDGITPRLAADHPNADHFLVYNLLFRTRLLDPYLEVEPLERHSKDKPALARNHLVRLKALRPYLMRCLHQHPTDRGSIIFAGKELCTLDEGGRAAAVGAWKRYLALHTDDEELGKLINANPPGEPIDR
ncbi:MAG: hypothetical protein GY930_22570 [bacterium]|nr:hypothetical protein [bacterium]